MLRWISKKKQIIFLNPYVYVLPHNIGGLYWPMGFTNIVSGHFFDHRSCFTWNPGILECRQMIYNLAPCALLSKRCPYRNPLLTPLFVYNSWRINCLLFTHWWSHNLQRQRLLLLLYSWGPTPQPDPPQLNSPLRYRWSFQRVFLCD